MRAQDKVVVVIGASMGIGEAVAAKFLSEGARVVLCSRDLERAQAARQRLGSLDRSFAFACDVTSTAQVEALAKATLEPDRQSKEAFGAALFKRMVEALGGDAAVRESQSIQAEGSLTVWARDGRATRWIDPTIVV